MLQLQAQEDLGFLGNREKNKLHADSREEASQDVVREHYYSCKTQTNTRVLPVVSWIKGSTRHPASSVHITAPWFQRNTWGVGQDIDRFR